MISYCINLDRRSDKWNDVIKEFTQHNINPIRFSAYDTAPGWKGCRDSHLSVLSRAKMDGLKQFAVYEDDVVFIEKPNGILKQAISQLPQDWDILYLGVSPLEPMTRYSENLFRVGKSVCLHATIYNNTKWDGVLDYILKHKTEIGKIDVFYSDYVHRNFNVFVTYPMICTQRQYKSDTCGRSDVSTIVKNYNKFLHEAD